MFCSGANPCSQEKEESLWLRTATRRPRDVKMVGRWRMIGVSVSGMAVVFLLCLFLRHFLMYVNQMGLVVGHDRSNARVRRFL
jgi:hypothetical protein